ncbi:LOW QUALITY PROTEIN: IQ domain-containing protein N [Eulemur rufifrons]|uniref:LOW QUALITY PROTEIN: IQ domain-containing protein N n=1 Tax=Eulemur rufifrons TaxID=859984 RepID=UPI003743020B
MTLQGSADPLRNRDDAASSAATAPEPAATRWAVLPPAPARPGLQDNLRKGSPEPQHGPQKAKERLSQQLAEAKTAPRRIPRLRAVVESQAFKNILVDEMDMMLSRAATLIQANWRRYRLRQKLISQVTAAKAIQEAWRRFSTRRLLRSSRWMAKKVTAEEGDIPYHAPQQVRFQHQEENRPSCRRRMLSKETQFPSSDSLAPSTPRPAPLPQPPEPVCPAAPQAPGVAFLPHQTVTVRFPCPVSLGTKCQPCLLTETVRSACFVHIEGDTAKIKHVTARTNKGGHPEPPPSGNSQAVTRPLKIQTQAYVETETFKGPLQICPGPVITKPLPQTYPVGPTPKTPPQTYSVPAMTKTLPKTRPVPTMVMTKTPPQVSVTKTPAQICPGPTAMAKTQGPVCPTASVTSTLPQPRPVATMAKIPPQACLPASTFKPLPQTRHMAMMAKTPPQVPLATTTAKSSLQTSPVATASKTSSQTCPVSSITKPPAQMRLAAMLTKTPAQVATVLRTLCLAPPTAGTLKAPPQAAVAAGILNTSSPIHLNMPKAKAATNMKQAPGAARVSARSYLADRKAKCFPQPHPGVAAPKAADKALLEAERIRAGPQRPGNADTASKTSVAVGMTRAMSWTKVVEEGNKDSLQAHLRTEVVKVQSQVYVPIEMAGTLPQGQPATSPTKALCHERPPCVPQGQPATSPTKALCHEPPPCVPQGQPATSPTKALWHEPPPCVPQGQPATSPTKALWHEPPPCVPQGQPATSPTKALCHEPPPCVPQGQPATSPTKALCHERPPCVPQGQPATSPTKALCHERPPCVPQGQPATSPTKALCHERPPCVSQGQPATSPTKALCHERPPCVPQGQPATSPTKALWHERPPCVSQGQPATSPTKALCHERPPCVSQGQPATSPTKALCHERPPCVPQGQPATSPTKALWHERPPCVSQGQPATSPTKALCHERPPFVSQGQPATSPTKALWHERPPRVPQGQPATSPTKALCHERPPCVPQGQPATSPTKALWHERPPCVPQGQPATSPTKALWHERPPCVPQGQPATSPTKALWHERPPCVSQGQPATSPTKALSQVCLPAELTLTQLSTCSARASSQLHLPTKVTKAPSLAHLVTCLSRVHSQSHLATGAMKFQSQAHLPTGLMKAQSQAQLVTDTAKCLFTAHQAADLTSKTQSQPLLAGSKASTQPCQHLGVLSTPPRAKPEDRLTQLQPHSHAPSKTSQGPRPVSPENQGMLVPVLASTVQPMCNIESWGDSGAVRAQPSLPSQAAPCQEDVAASQLASLCAELAAVLGSQEDLRVLLAKALSQGEVRAALNQALSKEVLGATVAKALPQGLLGMVLVKALSWSELGVTLSRALSRGELRAELTKAMQGKLAEVLSKALTDEERAALSQALCQGELGAVLSQSLSQAALRSGAILPKAASKTAGSGMTVTPAPVVVDCRGSLSAPWGPALGLVRTRCSKGPVDAGVAGGQSWNSAVPSVAVKPPSCAVAPRGVWEPAGDPAPWEPACHQAAVDPRLSPELMVSMQTVEAILIRAVITIQAGTRGYLVRRTIRIWHVMATVIQTHWRGYRVRRNLARLYRAITLIQAAWRGYCTRRDNSRRRQMLLPVMWGGLRPRSVAASHQPCFQDRAAVATSDHRCFQSCQPGVCSLCQSLSSGLGSPPSVVMLVGSNPRTCHMCGHTQLRRVVHGMGRGAPGHGGALWSPGSHLAPQNPRQLHRQNKAATSIQSAWRGFRIRRQMTEQQKAARMVQATWRGHYTRNCLTTDALLGRTSPWAGSRHLHSRWPGV